MSITLASTFGILGNIISCMVYFSPLPTFLRIRRERSTLNFQSVPYIVGLFSAMLWIFYAFVKTGQTLLISINAFGCVIQSLYIIIYFYYAPRRGKIETLKYLFLLNGVMFSAIVLFTLFLFDGHNRVTVLGWICVAFSVSVFAAPLAIIRLVLHTRSVEFMPFGLSVFLTLSAVMWGLYGAFSHDMYVALPNVLGFTFGVLQMALYLYFRNRTPRNLTPATPIPGTPALGTPVPGNPTPETPKQNIMDHLSGMIAPENLHVAIVSITPIPVVEVRRIEPDLEAQVPAKTVDDDGVPQVPVKMVGQEGNADVAREAGMV
ncbi:hypothetical protein LUZ60_015773 [Juncus effusus]|nr:hypothetical protein LUZ60_015773 [Juncus effusus]